MAVISRFLFNRLLLISFFFVILGHFLGIEWTIMAQREVFSG